MKLSINAIGRIMRLRRKLSLTATAHRLALPRHVVALADKHAGRLNYCQRDHATEIPGTGRGLWHCRGCGAWLEFAPCVKCGAAAPVPRQIKPPTPAPIDAPGILELSTVHVYA